jgi:hypothetical protein
VGTCLPWLLVVVLVATTGHDARGDTSAGASRGRVTASERYEGGALRRLVFGAGYRDLWETPIEIPVLDLESDGGGLTPIGRLGGLQTAVLGLEGRDGRSYTFRSVDKDPSAVLHPILWDTFVRDVVQNQMAAQHPAGALPATVVSQAPGVLTTPERGPPRRLSLLRRHARRAAARRV